MEVQRIIVIHKYKIGHPWIISRLAIQSRRYSRNIPLRDANRLTGLCYNYVYLTFDTFRVFVFCQEFHSQVSQLHYFGNNKFIIVV